MLEIDPLRAHPAVGGSLGEFRTKLAPDWINFCPRGQQTSNHVHPTPSCSEQVRPLTMPATTLPAPVSLSLDFLRLASAGQARPCPATLRPCPPRPTAPPRARGRHGLTSLRTWVCGCALASPPALPSPRCVGHRRRTARW
jgi:hypothetical protein